MRPFSPYIKRYRLPFIASVLVLGIEAVCDVLQPTLLALLIDQGIASGKLETITHYGLLMLLVTAIGACGALLRNYISSIVSFKASQELRRDLFDHIVHMSPEQKLRFDQGTLLTRLTNDVNQLQNFVTGLMRIFLKAPLLGLGSMVMVFRLSPVLFSVFLYLMPAMAILIFLNLKLGYPLYMKVQTRLDHLNERIRAYFSGIRVIRAFHRIGYESNQYTQVNKESAESVGKALRQLSVFGPFMSLLIQLSIVYCLYKSQVWVLSGEIGLGMLIAFIQYMLQFLFALMIITRVFNLFVRAKGSAHRIGELLSLKKMKSEKPLTRSTETEIQSLSFDAVDFSYLEGELVLKNISMKLEKGKRYGIIGTTGAGKSTLLQLLMGFYTPSAGQIMCNQMPTTQEELSLLRSVIGYVPQKTLLFTGTIKENLCFGNPDASKLELDQATGIAQIDDFIQQSPLRYETRVGRGGMTLSGGQKQRLAIARALLIKPELLILDDSTSALDSQTEYRFKKALEEQTESVMTLMVSQRISSVMAADLIYVMSEGSIEAVGTHAELLFLSKTYKELYDIQLGLGVS
jgi:ATP-binding cassette subfamily B protein